LFFQETNKQLDQYRFIERQLTNLDATSFVIKDNTSVCEGLNSLHSKIHPKDWYCMDLFGGLVGITVLMWNLGYEKTLKLIAEKLNVRISDKLAQKYSMMDNKVDNKRKYVEEKGHEINKRNKINIQIRKDRERTEKINSIGVAIEYKPIENKKKWNGYDEPTFQAFMEDQTTKSTKEKQYRGTVDQYDHFCMKFGMVVSEIQTLKSLKKTKRIPANEKKEDYLKYTINNKLPR